MKISLSWLVPLSLFAAYSAALAGDSMQLLKRFEGTWKEDLSKRKIASQQDTLTFQRSDAGDLQEVRGGRVPIVQPIHLDGKPYPTAVNSKDTWVWKQIDANTFERTSFKEGKTQFYVRRIKLSGDGTTLAENIEQTFPNGKTATVGRVWRRTSGEPQGLVGKWMLESSSHRDTASEMKYEALGANKLRVTSLNSGIANTLTLDGPAARGANPAFAADVVVALKRIADDTIAFELSRGGVVLSKSTETLSNDGNTLTVTTVRIGPNGPVGDPSTQVYHKSEQ